MEPNGPTTHFKELKTHGLIKKFKNGHDIDDTLLNYRKM